jgi:tetratricopeptide (TPR) repeat protein
MSNTGSVAERIGHAWLQHRDGNFKESLAEFEAILKQHPDDIDANYGQGLAHKALGHTEAAAASFKRSLALVEQARAEYERVREQQHPHDNVKTPEDDRFTMLIRMTTQRLSEVTPNVKAAPLI